MGLHCHQRFVSISDTTITLHVEEIEKWADRWNEALGYLGNASKVKPLFPSRGLHEHDLPDGDDETWGHSWLTLDEILNADYEQPVLGMCGTVICPSWDEYLDGGADTWRDHYRTYKALGATTVFYHFNR